MKSNYEELERQLAQLKMTLDAIRDGKVDSILGTHTVFSVQPKQLNNNLVDEALQLFHTRLHKLLDNIENLIHTDQYQNIDNIIGLQNTFMVQLKNSQEALVDAHYELEECTINLVAANDILQKEIAERKEVEKELKEKNDSLETFYKLATNRELKMIELKKEVNELLVAAGKEPRYKIVS